MRGVTWHNASNELIAVDQQRRPKNVSMLSNRAGDAILQDLRLSRDEIRKEVVLLRFFRMNPCVPSVPDIGINVYRSAIQIDRRQKLCRQSNLGYC